MQCIQLPILSFTGYFRDSLCVHEFALLVFPCEFLRRGTSVGTRFLLMFISLNFTSHTNAKTEKERGRERGNIASEPVTDFTLIHTGTG